MPLAGNCVSHCPTQTQDENWIPAWRADPSDIRSSAPKSHAQEDCPHISFFRLGERVLGALHLPLTVLQIYAMIQVSVWDSVRLLWITTWHGVAVWGLAAPVFVILGYVTLAVVLNRALRKRSAQLAEAD
jgi:hypothetical protein